VNDAGWERERRSDDRPQVLHNREVGTSDRDLERMRPHLPSTVAFIGAVVGFASLYLAAGAPSSLLPIYEEEWRFAPSALTVAFAAYAIGLVASLLTTGSLSDFIGRRPVLLGSLVVELAAMVLFLMAPNIEWVTVARVVQGVATGAATSAFSASLVELAPARSKRVAMIIASAVPAGGLGLGALLTGLAIQFSSAASQIVFISLIIVMAVSLVAVLFSDETAVMHAGAVHSLVPRISIPVAARREFNAAIPVHLAAWMLAGLFLGLVPTILRELFHIDSGLFIGFVVFLEPGSAAVSGFVLRRISPRHTVLLGGLCVLLGTVTIVAGIAWGNLPMLLVGAVVGGVGFGSSFSGAVRLVAPLVDGMQRAGLFAGIYLIAYLAFGVPAIIAGVLDEQIGLLVTVYLYGASIAVAALVGLIGQRRQSRI
jgi:MFS family permease